MFTHKKDKMDEAYLPIYLTKILSGEKEKKLCLISDVFTVHEEMDVA